MKMRQVRSFYSSAIFGNDKMFRPRWRQETASSDPEFDSIGLYKFDSIGLYKSTPENPRTIWLWK